MSDVEWLANGVFEAVRGHDLRASNPASAFCEHFERPQAIILRDHFRSLPGFLSEVEQPYELAPTTGSDLFIADSKGARAHCEIKAMYKTWFKRNRRPYPAYLWSPFRNANKTNSAGYDLQRLATYTSVATTHVAQIVLGSSLPVDDMAADLDEYARLARIDQVPWQFYRSALPNAHHRGYEYDIRVWICEREQLAEWWASIAAYFGPPSNAAARTTVDCQAPSVADHIRSDNAAGEIPCAGAADADRARALRDVHWFCSVPYNQHGYRAKSGPRTGWYTHDWGDLVQRISRIYRGAELPMDDAWALGNQVRRRFRNVKNWNAEVNRPGADEEILAIILGGVTGRYGHGAV